MLLSVRAHALGPVEDVSQAVLDSLIEVASAPYPNNALTVTLAKEGVDYLVCISLKDNGVRSIGQVRLGDVLRLTRVDPQGVVHELLRRKPTLSPSEASRFIAQTPKIVAAVFADKRLRPWLERGFELKVGTAADGFTVIILDLARTVGSWQGVRISADFRVLEIQNGY